jgi:hypothetical protein
MAIGYDALSKHPLTHPLLLSLSQIVTWALLGTCVMPAMTVTTPYLCGPVDDPHVAGGLVNDPRTNYLRGLVDDPRVAGGLVDDPRTNYLRGLVDDPCVSGGLVNDPHNNSLHRLVDDPCIAGGPVDDPRIHIIATYLQEFPQD